MQRLRANGWLRMTPLILLSFSACLMAEEPTSRPLPNVQAFGDATVEKGTLTVTSAITTLVIGESGPEHYRFTAELLPAPKAGATYVHVMPADPLDLAKPAALYASVGRDAEGRLLQSSTYRYDEKTSQWAGNQDVTYYTYWPGATDTAGLALVEGLPPRSWQGRWLRLRVEADRQRVAFWFDGLLVRQVERPQGSQGPVVLQLGEGDQLRGVRLAAIEADSLYLPVDLAAEAAGRFPAALGKPATQSGGVPFELLSARNEGDMDHVDLSQARWIEAKSDPADYYERYDLGPPVMHDSRMPFVRVPREDYVAAHLLAVCDDDPQFASTLALRAGRYGWSDQTVQHDFPGRVPRRGEAAQSPAEEVIETPAGPLFHVRVPLMEAFAQDMERFIDIELTKEIRLARRQPDPCRFRTRPLGLPSGVRIAAMTLERSPLQFHVGSRESGHAFVEPQQPEFQIRLRNITADKQAYRVKLAATHLDGTPLVAEQSGSVVGGRTAELTIPLPTRRGYHDLTVSLEDGAGRTLLERHTSFCLLPPDTRKHRDQSPFGTWDFCGGHYTSNNPDEVGPLYVKLGLRYGMSGFPIEKRKQYGVLPGVEPMILSGLKSLQDHLAANADSPLLALIFHETSVSGKHITRVPDLFHDRAPYRMDETEQKQFQQMWDQALAAAGDIKKTLPQTHLRFGNGALPTKEEFYRHKFPAALFDSGGNESPSFGRLPESQPPDCVAHNASLWMDRQLLDAFGYADKPVTQCYEICYPATNPGNLSTIDQANYLVRHGLHSLAWGVPQIKIGCISDMGNSYYFSNWGATGFCRSKPELSVKPSFVAMATLTRVLDGATFVADVPLGSPSLYGLEFRRPDGTQAYALWTIRGRRPLRLKAESAPAAWTLIDDQGAERPLESADGAVEVTLSAAPVYLVGAGKIAASEPGQAQYSEQPAGAASLLSSLAGLDDWTLEEGRNIELEFYDFMCPRRKGDFAFEPAASFEGRDGALRVTPRPISQGKETMPMYAVLAHKQGIAVPGAPSEIGLWVNGNSGWGRLMFELADASGQRWISIGAQQQGIPPEWIADMVPAELLAGWSSPGISDWNTEDVFGLSRINHDGWRYVAFPLPGNYPGENFPWPANSQWRWDKDGVVHYPLTFKKLIVELPEKVLHVKTYAPPPRPEIYLKDLTSAGEADAVNRAR